MPLVKDAENLFRGKLGGRAEIDPIHALFKKGELLDKLSDDEKIIHYEKTMVRSLLRRISIVLEDGGDHVKVRGVHNVGTWQKDRNVNEYVYLTKMTMEEITSVATRYYEIGNVYIAIGDKLMDIVTGQMLLFKRT